MTTKQSDVKARIIVDFGPTSILILSEIILIILKVLGYITFSWELVLAPILLVISGAVLILLFTLIKLIKDNLF